MAGAPARVDPSSYLVLTGLGYTDFLVRVLGVCVLDACIFALLLFST